MTALSDKNCQPCPDGAIGMTREEALSFLSELNEWSLADDTGTIKRTYTFQNFHDTMAFVNALAWIAHQEDHHPDLLVTYGTCQVTYSTHDIKGLSENDFICAAKLDHLML